MRYGFRNTCTFLLGLIPALSQGQGTCPAPDMGDFSVVTLIPSNLLVENAGSDGPVHMAVAANGQVFVAKMRTGQIIRHTPPNTNTNTNIGTIPTWFRNESGLLGIAVDRNFGASNNWLYAYTAGTSSTNRTRELVRYTVSGNSLTNRKVLLSFSTFNNNGDPYHAGGGMAFTDNGVLIIGVGDDTDPHAGNCNHDGWAAVEPASEDCDAQKSAGNTNDLRGGLVRINPVEFPDTDNPTPGVGNTYTIPPGNLRDVITGLPNWGGQNINLVRPEIFAKGTRNAYKVGVDTRSGWIFWAEVGPDANGTDLTTAGRGYPGQEEWNLTWRAGYFGWPYSNGNYFYNGYSANSLTNTSPFNTGVGNLPPPYMPQVWYSSNGNAPGEISAFDASGGETAMTGPMYRYNATSTSTVKFPPYYEGKVFFFEWAKRYVRTIQLNSNGTYNTSQAFSPIALPQASFIDLQFGPVGSPYEGALYMLRHTDYGYTNFSSSQLYRLDYTGPINNTCFSPFPNSVQGPPDGMTPIRMGGKALGGRMASAGIRTLAGGKLGVNLSTAGPFTLVIRDLRGMVRETLRGTGPGEFSSNESYRSGVYEVTVKDAAGTATRTIFTGRK